LSVVETICDLLDRRRPRSGGKRYRDLISFVTDRPGHDRRYAIDETKARAELGYAPARDFATGFAATLAWYLANEAWWRGVLDGSYRTWVETNYAARA
jgi:dTDP-glucose 4,6-dehydratase